VGAIDVSLPQVLPEERWPFTKCGRRKVTPSPIPVEVLGAPDQTYSIKTTHAAELRERAWQTSRGGVITSVGLVRPRPPEPSPFRLCLSRVNRWERTIAHCFQVCDRPFHLRFGSFSPRSAEARHRRQARDGEGSRCREGARGEGPNRVARTADCCAARMAAAYDLRRLFVAHRSGWIGARNGRASSLRSCPNDRMSTRSPITPTTPQHPSVCGVRARARICLLCVHVLRALQSLLHDFRFRCR
jgi:hypothetical protein